MMKITTLALLTVLASGSAYAQKLPNIQQTGVKPPATVKIDGKADDWSNKFEAYNPATELLYTIAHDDKRLYLIAQTNNETVMNRIANGGIKLVIQKSGAKNDDGAPFVKFPYMQNKERVAISFAKPPIVIQQGTGVVMMKNNDNAVSKQEEAGFMDSLMVANNKKVKSSAKFIFTNGFAGVEDLIPIYNDKGIEAALAFDNKKNMTCELAIDLNLLGLSATKGEKFSYHLVVNGEPNKFNPPNILINGAPIGSDGTSANQRLLTSIAVMGSTTDFWGEYTLAK